MTTPKKEHGESKGAEVEKDSLGQENPAWQMEKDNIKEAGEKAEKKEKEAEKEQKSSHL